MSTVRRVVLVALVGAFCAVLAAMATADQAELEPGLVTTPSTTQPVIAHIEETP